MLGTASLAHFILSELLSGDCGPDLSETMQNEMHLFSSAEAKVNSKPT